MTTLQFFFSIAVSVIGLVVLVRVFLPKRYLKVSILESRHTFDFHSTTRLFRRRLPLVLKAGSAVAGIVLCLHLIFSSATNTAYASEVSTDAFQTYLLYILLAALLLYIFSLVKRH